MSITLYDPLVPMLKNTGTFFEVVPDMANGVFEHIPFRDGEFDAVLCGYSLRDAINLRIAISEIHRVLKNGGRFVIVDLGKPDKALVRFGVSLYLRAILPILALIAGGKLGLKFATLYRITSYNVCYTKLLRDFETNKRVLTILESTGGPVEDTTMIVPWSKFPESVSLLSPSGKIFKLVLRILACIFFAMFCARF